MGNTGMMFSDVVGVVNALLSIPPGAFIPLLMFVLVFYFFGKLFRSLVLDGHWVILSLVSLGSYAFAAQMVREGQYVLALGFGAPLLFMGREGYRRLVERF